MNHFKFILKLNCWCEHAGGNITIDYIARSPKEQLTKVDDSNPFWVAFKCAVDSMQVLSQVDEYVSCFIHNYCCNNLNFILRGLPVEPGIASGGTDAKYLRRVRIHNSCNQTT